MPRDQGRNPRKGFLNFTQTMEMCELGADTIDAEIAASPTGFLPELKDRVYEACFINLSWWRADWVDFPGFCDYGGETHGAWVCIRMWWSKQHPGLALRWQKDDRLNRSGIEDGTWYVIGSWSDAMPVVEQTLDDNGARIDNDMKSFESLLPVAGNQAILRALQSAGIFVGMQFALIEAATWFTDILDGNPPATVQAMLGWVNEDNAIDAVERRVGFGGAGPRAVGRELWDVYP